MSIIKTITNNIKNFVYSSDIVSVDYTGKRIIILDFINGSVGLGEFEVRAVFWIPVQNDKKIPIENINFVSFWKGASAEEINNIINGVVVEKVVQMQVPPGTDEEVLTNMYKGLENLYLENQKIIEKQPKINKFLGTFWNGTSWTSGV